MAITTLAGIRSGLVMPTNYSKNAGFAATVAGRCQSSFYLAAGITPVAAAPTPGLAGEALTSYAGQIQIPSASNTTYLAGGSIYNSVAGARGIYMLCDRLWHNSGFTITLGGIAQTVNSLAWPARDKNNSTNGEGVYIGVEVSTATGTGTPTLSMSYTNSAGTAGRTSSNIILTVASANIGAFYTLGLQAGDIGVQSIQTFTLSATWTSGVIHLVAFRPIAMYNTRADGLGGNELDYLHNGLIPLPDNIVPFLLYQGGSTPPRPQMRFKWAQG